MPIGPGTPLQGEGGDRKFAFGGKDWRVRVKLLDEKPSDAPLAGGSAVPSAYGLVVSVALLNADGTVKQDALGRWMVFDPESLTFQKEHLERSDFDPDAEVGKIIEKRLEEAEKQVGSRAKVESTLSTWKARAPVQAAAVAAPPLAPPINRQP